MARVRINLTILDDIKILLPDISLTQQQIANSFCEYMIYIDNGTLYKELIASVAIDDLFTKALERHNYKGDQLPDPNDKAFWDDYLSKEIEMYRKLNSGHFKDKLNKYRHNKKTNVIKYLENINKNLE